MTEERKQELDREWNECDLMDDEEYRDWYEGLTDEEQALIDAWDKQYQKGALQICKEILDREERKPSIERQMAAAEAERLRQRAERLPEAVDIIKRLKAVREAVRQPERADKEPSREKDFANELNALRGEIEARETRAREQQKQDKALIDAVGDLADNLTSGVSR